MEGRIRLEMTHIHDLNFLELKNKLDALETKLIGEWLDGKWKMAL